MPGDTARTRDLYPTRLKRKVLPTAELPVRVCQVIAPQQVNGPKGCSTHILTGKGVTTIATRLKIGCHSDSLSLTVSPIQLASGVLKTVELGRGGGQRMKCFGDLVSGCVATIPAHRRQRQEGWKLEANLGHTALPGPKLDARLKRNGHKPRNVVTPEGGRG